MPAYELRITGKVQGVWYRGSARDKALELGVYGRIWNEADGAVCAFIDGDDVAVGAFITWCQEGPALARVDQVEVKPLEVTEAWQSFEIIRPPR